MEDQRERLAAPAGEAVRLEAPVGRGTRVFLAFLLCCAVLVAVFAVSRIWVGRRANGDIDPVGGTERTTDTQGERGTGQGDTETDAPLPTDAVAIRSMDLSGTDFRNETAHAVDTAAVRALIGGDTRSFSPDLPVVLILHTHAQEGYRTDGKPYLTGPVGDAIYTNDPEASVIAAGEALCRELTRGGVPAIHCTALHGEGGTLRGAYESAADCIRAYRQQYPSIEYVIDLHRDSVLATDGACLRTASPDGRAQIMAVVGSDGNGTDCPAWRFNLGLALCLADRLNAASAGSCRPAVLRNATYNQELAPHSLLLEIGSAGNTVEEAVEAATRVGQVLADLICNRPAQ